MEKQLEMFETDTRLSYSSASLLMGCETRYKHYKVLGTDKDPDYEDNQEQFVIGKSFHRVLEETKHRSFKEAGLKVTTLMDRCMEEEGLSEKDVPLVHAMVLSYLREFNSHGLQCHEVEFDIQDEEKIVIGFVDALVTDNDGGWWILDLKTSRSVRTGLAAQLPLNRQLNLYAYFYKQFAKRFGFKQKDFKGCIYSVTTKSVAKQKKDEEYPNYVLRMADSIRTKLFFIGKEKMRPDFIYKQHLDLYKRSMELRGGAPAKMNLDYCFSYFKPCPYFSNCYGYTYTEGNENG